MNEIIRPELDFTGAAELIEKSGSMEYDPEGRWKGGVKVKVVRDYSRGNLSDYAAEIPREHLDDFEFQMDKARGSGSLSARAYRKIKKAILVRRISIAD